MKNLIIISKGDIFKENAINPAFLEKCKKDGTIIALIGEVKEPTYDKENNEESIDMEGIENLHNLSFLISENLDDDLNIVVDAFPHFKSDGYGNFPNPGFLTMIMNTHLIDPKQIVILTENPENEDYLKIKGDYPNVVIEKI